MPIHSILRVEPISFDDGDPYLAAREQGVEDRGVPETIDWRYSTFFQRKNQNNIRHKSLFFELFSLTSFG